MKKAGGEISVKFRKFIHEFSLKFSSFSKSLREILCFPPAWCLTINIVISPGIIINY